MNLPDFSFWILIALTVLVGLAALWLIARSTKPLLARPRMPNLSGGFDKLIRKGLLYKLLESIKYLLTSRELRYAKPWVLFVGEKAAGKSSLVRSCELQLQDPCPPSKEVIQASGAKWHAFGSGDLIDPEIGEPGPEGQTWKKMLESLDMLRPERPIDKIVLVLSARTLQSKDADALHLKAQEALLLLESIQLRFDFALPVYLVITHCDAVTGFTAFWNTQRQSVSKQIFGWAAPSDMQGHSPDAWVKSAFSTLMQRLRQLLLAAAASREDIEDVDQAFLFPVCFRRLADPLTYWFSVVFQPSRWGQGFFCRGIYFTGSLGSDGEQEIGQRQDIAFVHDLFKERIFAEPHLATPTRKSIWSRNRLIRRVQLTALSVGIVLLLNLGLSARLVSEQVDLLDSALNSVTSAQAWGATETCQDIHSIEVLLIRIADLNVRAYPSIPLSWIDNRGIEHVAHTISEESFKDVIMPAIECRIMKKAEVLVESVKEPSMSNVDSLKSRKQQFIGYLAKVSDLELNLVRFAQIARSAAYDDEESLLRDFSDLFAYAFDQPLPKEMKHEKGVFREALANFSYGKTIRLPGNWRGVYSQQIHDMSENLRFALDSELASGALRLNDINSGSTSEANLQKDNSQLIWWLNWMRQSWLGATAKNNPCEEVRAAAEPLLIAMNITNKYQKNLADIPGKFNEESCFRPSIKTLGALRVAPYGNIFFEHGETLELNPRLAKEFYGLAAVMDLHYMQLTPRPTFNCLTDLAGLTPSLLAESNGYAREYLNFVRSKKLASADEKDRLSLYLRLAKRHLLAVMNGSVNAAQEPFAASSIKAGVNGLSAPERELMEESEKFQEAVPTLLETLDLYNQLRFNADASEIAQCVREYSADSLHRISNLAEKSRLYDQLSVDSSFPLPNDLAVTRNWLDRQISRIKVLAGYSNQYVSFLKNSQGVDEHLWRNDQDEVFWDNTIAQLELYLQFKEPNGQVAHLDTLFLKVMADMNEANCYERLADYKVPNYGNDLFSRLRRQRLNQAAAQCEERHDAPALTSYQKLAERFNRELSGRFPFASVEQRDVSPVTVKAFMADYPVMREEIGPLVEGSGIDQHSAARRFLEQMDAVAAFFSSNLAQTPVSSPLGLNVYFNTLPEISSGANQVISWSLSNGTAVASYPDGVASLQWAYGNPLNLRLDWASGSIWLPIADGKQTDMQVENTAALFNNGGSWALLRLIQTHRSSPAPVLDLNSPEKIQLEFTVPVSSAVGSSPKAKGAINRLHIAVEISDIKSTSVLPWPPQFPFTAPSAIED